MGKKKPVATSDQFKQTVQGKISGITGFLVYFRYFAWRWKHELLRSVATLT